MKFSKTWRKNYSETVTGDDDKKVLKKRYISPVERQKLVDNLRLV